MQQSTTSTPVFNGHDPRFPDLSRHTLVNPHFAAAIKTATAYNFSVLGIEHIIYELLSDRAFRSLIESAGGDPDVCRGSLTRSFREHASFIFGESVCSLSEDVTKLIGALDASMADYDSGRTEDPSVPLADFYIKVMGFAQSSVMAEIALQDCGAGSLLLDVEDVDFCESDYDFITARNDIDASEAEIDQMLDDQDLFEGKGSEQNGDLSAFFKKDKAKPGAGRASGYASEARTCRQAPGKERKGDRRQGRRMPDRSGGEGGRWRHRSCRRARS